MTTYEIVDTRGPIKHAAMHDAARPFAVVASYHGSYKSGGIVRSQIDSRHETIAKAKRRLRTLDELPA